METQNPKKTDSNHKPILPTSQDSQKAQEIGGTDGLEPTRYGDWENNGRCTDF